MFFSSCSQLYCNNLSFSKFYLPYLQKVLFCLGNIHMYIDDPFNALTSQFLDSLASHEIVFHPFLAIHCKGNSLNFAITSHSAF